MNDVNVLNYGIEDIGSVDPSQITSLLGKIGSFAGIAGLLMIIWLWILFKKSGKKGWLSIIPIANAWVYLSIAGLPGWLSLIPVANAVSIIVASYKLPKKYGKGAGFALGNVFFPVIFLGILALSKAKPEDKKEEKIEPMETPSEINVAPAPEIPSEPVPEIPSDPASEVPDLMAAPAPDEGNKEEINVVAEEKINAVEEPALNVEESPVAPVGPVEMPEPVQTREVPEANVINAFEMEAPVQEEVVNNVEPTPVVEELPKPEAPTEVVADTLEDVTATVPTDEVPIMDTIDSLEATFELPKMANEVINSDITATKKCPNCGHENEYSNKVCALCGSNLE